MENNKKIGELFNLFPDLELFDAKIKKPMEPYLHASSNVISMNAITANAMEKSKLGEASFYDLFSFPSLGEKICSDNTLSHICDNSNDACDILNPPTTSTAFEIPMKIIERVMDNRYEGDGTVHPGDHLLFLHELCGLFKCAGISMDEVRKKLFSVSLSGKAAHWYKLLENRHSLGWEEIASLFYSKFYPPHEVHIDRNYIYNFYPRDGESISQAWGRLKSLMLKCPIHELPRNVIVNNFYARLSGQHKDYLDACSEGSFTSKEVEARWDLLDRIEDNAEGWENDKGKESGINYDYECIEAFMDTDKFRNMSATYGLDSQVAANLYKAFASHFELPKKNFDKYHEPFKEACMKNEIVVNYCNKHAQTPKNAISYKHVNFCGMHRPCGINQVKYEYCIHHINEKTRKWFRALDDLGKKVCALYPFICEVCHEVGHFNFQCSSNDNLNPMRAANLYCDDEITPNQHDELLYFWGVKNCREKSLCYI